MTAKQPDWSNPPVVPDYFNITTGYDGLIAERAEEFFDSILDWLGFTERARRVFVERQPYHLQKVGSDAPGEEQYVYLLVVGDVLAASVIVRRSDSNNCHVGFASYLTPRWIGMMLLANS